MLQGHSNIAHDNDRELHEKCDGSDYNDAEYESGVSLNDCIQDQYIDHDE